MRRTLLIFMTSLLLIFSLEAKERAYPLISDIPGESYLFAELGSAPGITLSSRLMSLSLQYYYPILESIAITTDISFIDYKWEQFNFGAGLGTGITFKAEVGDFDSNILLRFPLKIQYGDIGLHITPMVTATMFEEETEFSFYGTANITYRWEL